MEPTFKEYFDKLSNSLDVVHTDIRANTTQLADLAKWCPVLERRVDQLSMPVVELRLRPQVRSIRRWHKRHCFPL
ncbi:hypothetical protein D1007_04253 [Hordeum vulgare]|nr:hypothetical protein D1007_04253 [Hordeum vulgare]